MQSSQAVFLSYASQDAQPALRICEALRAAGIEVWFDQSELDGGDVWDHKIRQQIRECALFLPVISEHTQARTEGYFRLEWRLAEERTHLMGRTRAFVVPVCVDGTPERDADVPESFVRVHWTRLPAGATPAAFCERIAALLSGATVPGPATASHSLPSQATSRSPAWKRAAWIGASVVVGASLAAVSWRVFAAAAHSAGRCRCR